MKQKMKKYIRYTSMFFSVGLLCVAVVCARVYAEDKPVSIAIDKQSVALGDACIFTITSASGEIDPPQISNTPDMDISYIGAQQDSFSSFQLVINGRQVNTQKSGGTIKYQYRVFPKRLGMLSFPAVDIAVKGKVFRTNPFILEVVDKTAQSDDVFCVQEVNKGEVFIGEEIVFSFKWYFNQDIEGYECTMPWLSSLKGFVVRDPELDDKKQYQRFVINGRDEVFAEKTTERHKGKEYAVISFKKILVPLATGVYDLQDTFLKCDVVKGYQRSQRHGFLNDFFESDFDSFFGMGRRAVTEPLIMKSEPLQLVVRDLPEDNKPDAFTNAIGNFTFDVALSSSTAKVGEPVTLAMTIVGDGNMDAVVMPPFPEIEGLKGYEPESSISREVLGGKEVIRKVFTKMLIPTREGKHTIEALHFSFFDSTAKKYKTITRGPFEITVTKGDAQEQEVRIIALDTNGDDGRKTIQVLKQDIRFIKTSLGTVVTDTEPLYRRIGLLVSVIIFPAICVLLLFFYNQKRMRLRHDAAYAGEQRAYAVALKALRGFEKHAKGDDKDFYFDVMRVLNAYLSAKLHLPIGGITSDVTDVLHQYNISDTLIARMRECYEKSDQIKYGVRSVAGKDQGEKRRLVHELRDIISQMDKELKR